MRLPLEFNKKRSDFPGIGISGLVVQGGFQGVFGGLVELQGIEDIWLDGVDLG